MNPDYMWNDTPVYKTMGFQGMNGKYPICHHQLVIYHDPFIDHQSLGCDEPSCRFYFGRQLEYSCNQDEENERLNRD